MQRSWMRWSGPGILFPFALVGAALSTLGSPAAAGIRDLSSAHASSSGPALGPTLVALDNIRRAGMRSGVFVLTQETELHVRAEGVSDPKGRTFLSHGWILDLKTRRPVWTMTDVGCCYDEDSENFQAEGDVTLPAGDYGVYFAAFGGKLPMNGEIKIWGVPFGNIKSEVGPTVKWDDEGDPERWGIWVTAKDRGFKPAPVPAHIDDPFPDAVVRELGLKDSERRRVGLELTKPVRFHLWATGEWWEGADAFADGSWIIDRSNWRRVWQLQRENTQPAGGSDKNRLFDGEVSLARGKYLVTAFTDDSHATDTWNDAPPWDPDGWGLALVPIDPADRAACRVTDSPSLPSPTLDITRVGDNQTICKPFRMKKSGPVLIHALGEKSGGIWADFGWIENRANLEPVWEMDSIPSYPAGGASKNREVESVVNLAAGSYNLCFATDDSHSFDDWNTDPPYDPDDWGIAIAGLSGNAADIAVGETPDDPIAVSLAPVRSGQHLVKRFASEGKTRVLLIAVGEGNGDEMADYGWLENSDTGERVWEMRIEETHWAGGAKKNREERIVLNLPAAKYALHYETDDSHAFDDWNSVPPRQPQLWGVTLIELPAGSTYTPRYKSEMKGDPEEWLTPGIEVHIDGKDDEGGKGKLDELREKFKVKLEEKKRERERKRQEDQKR